MSPPPAENQPPIDYVAMFKAAAEATEAKGRSDSHADDLVSTLARLAPAAPRSPWTDWLRSSLLPLAIFAVGAFVAYGHDQANTAQRLADLSKNLGGVSQRLDRDERDTADRVRDLVPIIRAGQLSQTQSELIDKQQNDRIEAMAQSILQLRATVEKLSEAVSKTHEDLMIDRARRGEKESRLEPRAPAVANDLHRE